MAAIDSNLDTFGVSAVSLSFVHDNYFAEVRHKLPVSVDLSLQQRYAELLEKRIVQLEALLDAGSKIAPDVVVDKGEDKTETPKPNKTKSDKDKSNPQENKVTSEV